MHRVDPSKTNRVLVVDDDPLVRNLIVRQLRGAGCDCAQAVHAQAAWDQLRHGEFELVTLDIRMPGGSGLELLSRITRQFPDVAVLMLTGEGDVATAVQAMTQGAYGYLSKPFSAPELLMQVERALERRRLVIENRLYTQSLEQKVAEQTRAIRKAHEETIYRLVRASLCRDDETGAHIQRTGWYSELLAGTLGWDKDACERIRLAAPMHDIGKIGIPDAILCKPGKLTPEEMTVMQTHTILGAEMLADSDSDVLRTAAEIALSHHERWDGRGYPHGLSGAAIPAAARIVAIADVYDALTHDRVYRPAFSEAEALRIMISGDGSQFDPECFAAFASVLPEMRAIAELGDESASGRWRRDSHPRAAGNTIAALGV